MKTKEIFCSQIRFDFAQKRSGKVLYWQKSFLDCLSQKPERFVDPHKISVHKMCLQYKRQIQSSIFEYLFKVIDSDRLDEIKEMNVFKLIYRNYWIQIIFGHLDDRIKHAESVSFERKNRCLTLNVCLSNTWFFLSFG